MLDWTACLLVKGLGRVLCALPPQAAVWLGECLGGVAFRFQPKRVRIGVRNLQAAFDGRLTPQQARKIILACFRQMGAGIFELLRLPVMDKAYIDRHVVIEGRQHFDAARASGRPRLFITGHFGSWEMIPIIAALNDLPIVALARAQQKFPRLYRLLVSYRESKGCKIVHKGGALRQMIAALDNGQPVGIVGDQASRQGIFIDFFGRPALFATGMFELALKHKALIIPSFIHRVGGPFHRFVMEPAFELSDKLPRQAAIREGVERFTGRLAEHISEDPAQWLWMHKRWKHTPARRVLLLSDGKAGHVRQSLAIVAAMQGQGLEITNRTVEVRYRSRLSRLFAVCASGWMPAPFCGFFLRWMLTPQSAKQVLTHYADVVVSCGSATLPINLIAARLQHAKSVVLMNPAPLPLGCFDLVIAPNHDRLPRRKNVVSITGAMIESLAPQQMETAAQALKQHPRFRGGPPAMRGGVIAVLLGGNTDSFMMTESWMQMLADQLLDACKQVSAQCMVTTSRRTPPQAEQLLAAQLKDSPHCRLLLLASRDELSGTMAGLLGMADAIVATDETVSMVTEALGSGKPVVLVKLPPRRGSGTTRQGRFITNVMEDFPVSVVAVTGLSAAIQRLLHNPRRVVRLDNAALVRPALKRLL